MHWSGTADLEPASAVDHLPPIPATRLARWLFIHSSGRNFAELRAISRNSSEDGSTFAATLTSL